jgi:hypothetical protein
VPTGAKLFIVLVLAMAAFAPHRPGSTEETQVSEKKLGKLHLEHNALAGQARDHLKVWTMKTGRGETSQQARR